MLDQQFEEKTKINSLGSILQRLNNLWNDAQRHYRANQLIAYSLDLDMVWTELCIDTDKKIIGNDGKEKESLSEMFDKFQPMVEQCYLKDDEGNISYDTAKLRAILLKKHVFLRKLQKAKGMGEGYQNATEDDLD